jgi:uncharacterized tellurite resistance protein B-like protein
MAFSRWLEALRELGRGGDHKNETDTIRKIVSALDALDPQRAKYIAAFAYVLSRVARADMNISKAETSKMEQLVIALSGLPEEQAILVVQIAKSQATLFGGTENFLVTETFNEMATREQKRALLKCLFAVWGIQSPPEDLPAGWEPIRCPVRPAPTRAARTSHSLQSGCSLRPAQ